MKIKRLKEYEYNTQKKNENKNNRINKEQLNILK